MLTDMQSSQNVARLLRIWQILVSNIDKNKKNVLVKISVALLSNLNDETAVQYACDVINPLKEQKTALDLQIGWNTTCNISFSEWNANGYYQDLLSVIQYASRMGRHGLLPLVGAYNSAKQKLQKENEVALSLYNASKLEAIKPEVKQDKPLLNEADQMLVAEQIGEQEETITLIEPVKVQFTPKKLAINMDHAFRVKITTAKSADFVDLLPELFVTI